MAPLTWRNVDAPNFSSAIQGIAVSGQLLDRAGSGLTEAVNSYQDGRTQANSAQLMADILKNKSPAELQSALSRGVLGNLDPRYITPEALNFAADYQTTLLKNDLANRELALRGSGRGGRGGSGGGGGGDGSGGGGKGSVIPINVAEDNGYVNPDGSITNAAPIARGTPASTVADIASQLPYAPLDPVTNEAVPSAQSLAAITSPAPSRVAQVAPTIENAAALPQQVAQAAPTPVAQTVASPAGSMIQPVQGFLRGPNRVKGNDGGAQIFPELTQDVASARIAAYAGNTDQANNSFAFNPRINRNLTATDTLKALEFNMKAAEDGIGLRKNQREEADAVRNQNLSEAARSIASALTASSPDAATAKSLINIEEVGPEVAQRAAGIIDGYAKDGLFGENTSSGTPAKTDASGKSGTDSANAAPTETVAVPDVPVDSEPNANTDIGKQAADALAQIRLDRTGSRNAPIISSLNQVASDNSTVADVVDKKFGKESTYLGMDRDEYTGYLRQAMDNGLPRASMAAIAIDDSLRDPGLLGMVPWGDGRLDTNRLNEITGLFRDGDTGLASPRFLQERQRLVESTTAEKAISDAAKEAEKAQAALDKATRLKETTRPNLDISKLQDNVSAARTKAETAIQKALNPQGGPAYLYRGNFPAAPVAEAVPEPVQNRPVATQGGIVPPDFANRSQQVFEQLRNSLGREPTRREELNLRRRAREMVLAQTGSSN